MLLAFFIVSSHANLCTFKNLRQYNLADYNVLLENSHLILNFEPNQNYFDANISMECYNQAYKTNGKACLELINNQSYNHFFLYTIHKKYIERFKRACKHPYKSCYALENYEYYDRSFFDCHNHQSHIFVYEGMETLIKIEEKHLLSYPSKPVPDAILYKVSPDEIVEQQRFLYKVTISENEMVSHDARICHGIIVKKYPIKRIVCFY